jgi:hypothetical protein
MVLPVGCASAAGAVLYPQERLVTETSCLHCQRHLAPRHALLLLLACHPGCGDDRLDVRDGVPVQASSSHTGMSAGVEPRSKPSSPLSSSITA